MDMSVKNLYRELLLILLCFACTKPQPAFEDVNGVVVEAVVDGKVVKNNTNVTDVKFLERHGKPVEEKKTTGLNPVVIVIASALVILGVVILIFGKKREKK